MKKIALSIVPVAAALLACSSIAYAETAYTCGDGNPCLYSVANGSGGAIVGQSNSSGEGVEGSSSGNHGVAGVSGSNGSAGVYGYNQNNGYGVWGQTTGGGSGVYGQNTSSSGFGGNFNGRLLVQGNQFSTTSTAFSIWSDERLKKNIKPMDGALDRLLQLRGVMFDWKDPAAHGNQAGAQRGFIAQEVEKVIPEWVELEPASGFKTVNTRGIDAMFVESFRTLKTENDTLKDRVKALEANRRPMISGVGEGGLGLGLVAVAGAIVVSRRKRSDAMG